MKIQSGKTWGRETTATTKMFLRLCFCMRESWDAYSEAKKKAWSSHMLAELVPSPSFPMYFLLATNWLYPASFYRNCFHNVSMTFCPPNGHSKSALLGFSFEFYATDICSCRTFKFEINCSVPLFLISSLFFLKNLLIWISCMT